MLAWRWDLIEAPPHIVCLPRLHATQKPTMSDHACWHRCNSDLDMELVTEPKVEGGAVDAYGNTLANFVSPT